MTRKIAKTDNLNKNNTKKNIKNNLYTICFILMFILLYTYISSYMCGNTELFFKNKRQKSLECVKKYHIFASVILKTIFLP